VAASGPSFAKRLPLERFVADAPVRYEAAEGTKAIIDGCELSAR